MSAGALPRDATNLEPTPTLTALPTMERSMTRAQAGNYARFARSVTTRGLPEAVAVFLLVLREHQLHAALAGPDLARRAAEYERTAEHAPGDAPHGSAPAGHTHDGRFSVQRLSNELTGRSRLPRRALVAVVAEAYAARCGEPSAEVLARLETLRVHAEHAAAEQERRRRDR